jgi:hypothetical protein
LVFREPGPTLFRGGAVIFNRMRLYSLLAATCLIGLVVVGVLQVVIHNEAASSSARGLIDRIARRTLGSSASVATAVQAAPVTAQSTVLEDSTGSTCSSEEPMAPAVVLPHEEPSEYVIPQVCSEANRHKTSCYNGEKGSVPSALKASKKLNIAFLVQSSGSANANIAPLWQSIKKHCFHGHDVHLVVFTDNVELVTRELAERPNYITVVHQQPLDSVWEPMARHFLFLKYAPLWQGFDVIFVVHNDMLVMNSWNDRVLLGPDGNPAWTIGTIKTGDNTHNSRVGLISKRPVSSTYISPQQATTVSYFSSGLFGGTANGLAAILRATTSMAREDLKQNPRVIPLHGEESLLNAFFAHNAPSLALGTAFDRQAGLIDAAWRHQVKQHALEAKLTRQNTLTTASHDSAPAPLTTTLPGSMTLGGKDEEFPMPIKSIKAALSQVTVIVTGLTDNDENEEPEEQEDLEGNGPAPSRKGARLLSSVVSKLKGLLPSEPMEEKDVEATAAQRSAVRHCQLVALLRAFAATKGEVGEEDDASQADIVVIVREKDGHLVPNAFTTSHDAVEFAHSLPNLRLAGESSWRGMVATPYSLVIALNANTASRLSTCSISRLRVATKGLPNFDANLKPLQWLLLPLQSQRFDLVGAEIGLIKPRPTVTERHDRVNSAFTLRHQVALPPAPLPPSVALRGGVNTTQVAPISKAASVTTPVDVTAVRESFVLDSVSLSYNGLTKDKVALHPEFETESVACWMTEAVGIDSKLRVENYLGSFLARTSLLDEVKWSPLPLPVSTEKQDEVYSGSLDPSRDAATRQFFSHLQIGAKARVAFCATAEVKP